MDRVDWRVGMEILTEAQVWALAGGEDPPVLAKEERDDTQSAVCLKRFATGFVLGVSSETLDRIEFYRFNGEASAFEAFNRCVELMNRTGLPFEREAR